MTINRKDLEELVRLAKKYRARPLDGHESYGECCKLTDLRLLLAVPLAQLVLAAADELSKHPICIGCGSDLSLGVPHYGKCWAAALAKIGGAK